MADQHSKPDALRDDVDGALRDIAELETALGLEISRLHRESMPVPGATTSASWPPRPLWWWRTMLTKWAEADRVRRAHPGELLDGLSLALRDFDDRQLLSYLQTVQAALRDTA